MTATPTPLRELPAKWRSEACDMRHTTNEPGPHDGARAEELEACADELEAALSASGEAAVLAWLIVYRGKVIGYATHDSKPHVRLAEDETLVPVAAVAPAGMDGWQPIATAPKDGSTFLVYLPGERRKVQTAWQNENGVMAVGACFAFDLTPATHWQPLPTPPAQEHPND